MKAKKVYHLKSETYEEYELIKWSYWDGDGCIAYTASMTLLLNLYYFPN